MGKRKKILSLVSSALLILALEGCLGGNSHHVYLPDEDKNSRRTQNTKPPDFHDPWNNTLKTAATDELASFIKDAPHSHSSSPFPPLTQHNARPQKHVNIKGAKNYLFKEFPTKNTESDTSKPNFYAYARNNVAPDGIDPYGTRLYEHKIDTLALWLQQGLEQEPMPWTQKKSNAAMTVKSLLRVLPNVQPPGLIGVSQETISSWLGDPHQKLREGYTEIWQFLEDECVLSIYFYKKDRLPAALKHVIRKSQKGSMITAYIENYALPLGKETCSLTSRQ